MQPYTTDTHLILTEGIWVLDKPFKAEEVVVEEGKERQRKLPSESGTAVVVNLMDPELDVLLAWGDATTDLVEPDEEDEPEEAADAVVSDEEETDRPSRRRVFKFGKLTMEV